MLTLDDIWKQSSDYLPAQPASLDEPRHVNLVLKRLLSRIRMAFSAANDVVMAQDFDLWLEAARKAVYAVEILAREEHEMARSEELLSREEVEQEMKQIKSEWDGYGCFAVYLKAYQAQYKDVPINAMPSRIQPSSDPKLAPSVTSKSRHIPSPKRERYNPYSRSSHPASSLNTLKAKHASTNRMLGPPRNFLAPPTRKFLRKLRRRVGRQRTYHARLIFFTSFDPFVIHTARTRSRSQPR